MSRRITLAPGTVTQQPNGRAINKASPLIASGKLIGLLNGNTRTNLVDGSAAITAGNVGSLTCPQGVGVYTPYGGTTSGDLTITVEQGGGSAFTDFWYGYYYGGSGLAYTYLFGDYNGTTGGGIASKHSGIGGNWGYFDGAGLTSSGEALTPGTLYCFVVTREVPGGPARIYLNGVLKLTTTIAQPLQTGFTVGSLGPNSYSSYSTESLTFLAGRIRYTGWNAAQVREFCANPWQLFKSPAREIFTDSPLFPSKAVLLKTVVRTTQPQQSPQIDRSNLLGAKVIDCMLFNADRRTIVLGTPIVIGNGAIQGSSRGNLSLRSPGAISASVPLNLSAYSEITVACWLYWDSYANDDALAFEFTPNAAVTNSGGFTLDPNAASGNLEVFSASTVGAVADVTIARPSAFAWHRVTFTLPKSGLIAVFVDGIQKSIITNIVAAQTGTYANATLNLFSRNGNALFATGNLECLTIYRGILTAQEIAADYANCYQVFK
jgi:hypothetical protein